MSLIFYPHLDELETSNLDEKLEVLLESAERYKAAVLDLSNRQEALKRLSPRDIEHVFNWEELAKVLKDIRELHENNTTAKAEKADKLNKLAEIYEVLRGAKMPKLEAVRIALANEVTQLRSQ